MNSDDIKLKKIEDFFEYNLKAKELLMDMIPTEIDFFDEDAKNRYSNKLLRCLEKMELYLSKMMLDGNIRKLNEFRNLIEKIRSDIFSGNMVKLLYSGYDATMKYVRSNITDMRPEFVNSVNTGFVGYYLFYGSGVLEPITLNEFIHYIHSFTVNRESFYASVPVVENTKTNELEKGISLRGIKNDIGEELYKGIAATKLDSGCIDILNLTNKIIIMARDLGHATVLEIEFEETDVFVKYFIPKNNNTEMMRRLNGIDVINEEFATGKFLTTKENLTEDICDLMKGIPTDLDRPDSKHLF